MKEVFTHCHLLIFFQRLPRDSLLAVALWDHVTFDQSELSFMSGDVIEVTDLVNRDWWRGRLSGNAGWFPAALVTVCTLCLIISFHCFRRILLLCFNNMILKLICKHNIILDVNFTIKCLICYNDIKL